MKTLICLFAFVGLCLGESIDPSIEPGPIEYTNVLDTELGSIRGVVRNTSPPVESYIGIRYGRAERFEKPVESGSWEGVYNATHVRHACPQTQMNHNPEFADWKETSLDTNVTSEDCLFLNVWRPAGHQAKPRPVMVWIHGGAYTQGTIFSHVYDARYISALGEVVVVSIAYRLGAFGFLAGPDVEKNPGNLGLYDMKLGLEWVQHNIHSFGGDPHSVTIFGESAGAMAVGSLVLSPLTDGLFTRAILQSGAPNSAVGSENRTVSINRTLGLSARLNCESQTMIDCLKNRSVGSLTYGGPESTPIEAFFVPNYPESFSPASPKETFKTFNRKIDLLFGTNSNEGELFDFMIKLDTNVNLATLKDKMHQFASRFMVDNVTDLVQFYTNHLNEASSFEEMRRAVYDFLGDYHIQCPTVFFGQRMINRHKYLRVSSHHYAYRLVQPLHSNMFGCRSGVCHALDLVYVFGFPIHYGSNSVEISPNETIIFNDNERKLSREMILAWTRFARSGTIGLIELQAWSQANSLASGTKKASDVHAMELFAGKHRMQYSFARCNYLEQHILF